MNQNLALNIEHDILAPLGTEWTMYRAPGADGGLSFALVTHLSDGPAFAKTLDTLEKLFNERGNAPFKVEKVTAGKTEVSLLAVATFNAAWTVKDGYLYVSSLNGITSAMTQVENHAPSIVTSDLYQQVRASLPQDVKPSSITYAHPARLYPEIRALVLGFLPLARSAGYNVPMNLLPDPAAVSEFMPPGGSIGWADADGFHLVSHSAFPGAQLLGQQGGPSSGVAVAAVGAAMLVPAMGKSRESAQRVADAASLRQLILSTLVWAGDHNQLPDHLARLVASNAVTPNMLVSRRSGTQPLVMTPELEKLATDDFPKFASKVDEHCDFNYLGSGLAWESNASVVLIYEKPARYTVAGINAAFADGHVEMVAWPSVPGIFKDTNDFLTHHGRPAVDVDALMKHAQVGGIINAPPAPQPALP
jgi:prepilin-type processing-associated H-X9-DG protein